MSTIVTDLENAKFQFKYKANKEESNELENNIIDDVKSNSLSKNGNNNNTN